MNILIILLRVVEVLVCLMLVGIILMQRSKGSGAGVSFGGGAAEAIFGAQMGNVLTKATVILGFVFLANTLALSILQARSSGISADGSIMDGEPPAAAAPVPYAPPAAPTDLGDALDDVPRADLPAATPAPAAPVDPAAPTAAAAAPAASPEVPAAPAAGE